MRVEFDSNKEWQDIEAKAYPPPPAKVKVKKVKNLGTGFPGKKKEGAEGSSVEANADGSVKGDGAEKVAVGTDVKDALEKLDVKEAS
jgi:tyrosyl-tRNA synthetase